MGLSLDFPLEIEIGSSTESFLKALESQQALFHRQVGQLQNIVVTQCKLSGANPLSQEMAAGALSIKIGKRPRDLLNPKAVEHLHSVFSIKDVISKKESHDIAVRFGMTVTQVKEFFASLKSRVRKFVRLSTEKAASLRDNRDPQEEMLSASNHMILIDPLPLNTVGPLTTEETSSGSNQEDVLDGTDESEKYFVNNIFSMMRKEESFSGQVKLMEWILQMKNPSVLCWFLMKGGLMILSTWLSLAATEEQTSVLAVALEVLNHLPLNKALPVHMSAAIQGVNRLRFYPKSDISEGARVLLSRWSKMFAKSQAMRKPNGIKSSAEAHKVIDLKQRISQLMGDVSLQSPNSTGDNGGPYGAADETRRLDPQQTVKLLTSPADDSTKKQALGSTYKERRKVLLVEQPGQKTPGKNHQAPKTILSTQTRPITADEIQKAKVRAQFMQNKHSRIGSSGDSCKSKSEAPKRSASSLLTNDLLSASEAYLHPKLEAHKKARFSSSKTNKLVDVYLEPKLTSEPKKVPVEGAERLRVQLPWKRPPEVKIDESWNVAAGEDSKEVEVQRNRVHREKETIYNTPQEIPPNPRDPWDIEMDYDDTLTPEIPIDQLPDDSEDTSPQEESPLISNSQPMGLPSTVTNSAPTVTPPAAPTSTTASSQTQTPDLDLLAVLLKNPQLVFALTTGQNIGLPNVDTVKLLDMLKLNTGSVGTSTSNGFTQNAVDNRTEEVVSLPSPTPTIPARNGTVEVSLPSPTPASRYEVTSLPSPTPSVPPPLSGWQQEAAVAQKNPFSRQVTTVPGPSTALIPAASQPSGSNRLAQQTSLVQNGFATVAPDYTAPASSSWSNAPSTFRQENQMQQQSVTTDYYRQQKQHMRDTTSHSNASDAAHQQFPAATEQQHFRREADLRNLIKARQGTTPSYHHPQYNNQNLHDHPSHNMSVGRFDGKNHVVGGGSGYRSSLSPENGPNRYTNHVDRGRRYGYHQQQEEMIHNRDYGGPEGSGSRGRNSRYRGHNNGNWHRGGQRWNDRTR